MDVFDSMEYRENKHTASQKSGSEMYHPFPLLNPERMNSFILTNHATASIADEVGGETN